MGSFESLSAFRSMDSRGVRLRRRGVRILGETLFSPGSIASGVCSSYRICLRAWRESFKLFYGGSARVGFATALSGTTA